MAHAQIDDYFLERLHLLTRNEIIVYCYLLKKRNGNTRQCNPKQITIASETGLKTSRVSEAVKGLESKGWAICDEFGNYILPEKVTESVTKKVTENVSIGYGRRNKKLRKTYVEVTESVSSIRCTEKTIEKTIEKTSEEEGAEAAPAPTAQDSEILKLENTIAPETSLIERKQPPAAAAEIFAHWKEVCVKNKSQAIFNKKRKNAVEAILKEGYTVEAVKDAINGCNITPHNNGANSSRKEFKDLELICRNGSNLERFQNTWLESQTPGAAITTTNGGNNGQFKSSMEKRSETAIRDYHFREEIRQRVNARRTIENV